MNEELLTRISASSQLPTLPAIAIKVLELTRREDLSVPEIASVIMTDPALASKILKTVNSPFYGLTKQVSTISGALVILGLQAAKTLALGFSLLTNLRTGNHQTSAFDQTAFWKHSVYAAVASRVLARKLSVVQQEEAFLAGLLANMGSLVLHRVIPDEFDPLHAQAGGDSGTLNALCREQLGVDPPAVAALLAGKWQLPPLLARPIALQITREETDPRMKPLVDAVATGVQIASVFVADDAARAISEARQVLFERFNLSAEEIESLLDQIGRSARESASLLELPIGREKSYQEILDEAQEALVAISLQSQQQVQTIQREVATLQVKAITDSLTGLANRARFDDYLDEQFRRAFAHQRPLALVFIDIDHFKNVNDTHGHQVGDEVLRRIARLARSSVRNIDLAARYGGEEFAIVLTEADTGAAAVWAENLRAKLAEQPLKIGDKAITITLSAGVAGTDRTRIFSQSSQLTNAADRAVYAAKSAGRNCVRLFKPLQQNSIRTTPAAVKAH